MPPAILTVSAVPSANRVAIRNWIANEVEPESRAWMESLASRSATWLDAQHNVCWLWKPELDVSSTVA